MSELSCPADSARILVIDDQKVICSGCKLALSERGHLVDTVFDGKSGIVEAQRSDYDLILLDMRLPDMDGMAVLNEIRQAKPDINIIIMTGYASVENAVKTMKLGAFDYLSKPFSDDELIFSAEKAIENKRLIQENITLRRQLYAKFDFSNIVGENSKLKAIFEKIRRAAPTDTTILLEGESGTGKELFANAIHAHSRRAARQLVVVDCSIFAPSLLESELFGHVRGAFTGAIQNKPGVFEIADGGTLFLDEVANLSTEVQGKLLRVMETQQYKPVGSNLVKKTNIRIIAATNQDLKNMVEKGLFREDLFYRLYVLPIYIPPLRHRKDDIPKLAYHFLRIFCKEMGRRIHGFSDDALVALTNYDWPGNVRQLKNIVERLVIMSDESVLNYRHLLSNLRIFEQQNDEEIPKTWTQIKKLKQKIIEEKFRPVEKEFLSNALKEAEGQITRAAERVGMQRSNFSSLLKKHKIDLKKNTG